MEVSSGRWTGAFLGEIIEGDLAWASEAADPDPGARSAGAGATFSRQRSAS
jgi:hypothetical protein